MMILRSSVYAEAKSKLCFFVCCFGRGAVEPGQADLHPEVEEEKGQGTTDYSTLKSPPGASYHWHRICYNVLMSSHLTSCYNML